MKDALTLLDEAYENMELQIKAGCRFPTRLRPIVEMIQAGYQSVQEINDRECYNMYTVFREAGREYGREYERCADRPIGFDSAFSSVICAVGVTHGSPEWYKIMAYHYERRAEEILRRYERDSGEY